MRNIIIKLLLSALFILFTAFIAFGEENSALNEMTKLPEIEYQQIFINGNKEFEVSVVDGKFHGEAYKYSEDGNLKFLLKYENNEIVHSEKKE